MGSSKSTCCLSGLTATLRDSYDQVPDFKPMQCNRKNPYYFSAGLKKTSCKVHSKKEENVFGDETQLCLLLILSMNTDNERGEKMKTNKQKNKPLQ